jgi:hypothetical protein
MSSLVRRIQRMRTRTTRSAQVVSITRHFGDKLGIHNDEAKDLLARKAREARR